MIRVVEKGCPIVVCGSGLLKITDASFVGTKESSQFLPLKNFELDLFKRTNIVFNKNWNFRWQSIH